MKFLATFIKFQNFCKIFPEKNRLIAMKIFRNCETLLIEIVENSPTENWQ